MKFCILRETLLKPLQLVVGVVERRQTMPILANVLLSINGQQLSLTGTDLEVELIGRIALTDSTEAGDITIPARKLMDICRSLPEQALIDFTLDNHSLIMRSQRSKFVLTTLPATGFPTIEDGPGAFECNIEQRALRKILERSYFAMAQQDVRYYLNGMLLDIHKDLIRAVATDGHRLAFNSAPISTEKSSIQVIMPRKGVLELMRLLSDVEDKVSLIIGSNYIRVVSPEFTFTSKLIDGRFPDYERVIPKGGDKIVTLNRELFKQALGRVSILSNEKYRGVRLLFNNNKIKLCANNPEREEAEEELEINYQGNELDIAFNVTYLLDVLSALSNEEVQLTLSNSNSSMLVEGVGSSDGLFVVMPMQL